MVKKDVIAVAIDGKYVSGRPDAEGEFYRRTGVDLQNIFALVTPNGKVLAEGRWPNLVVLEGLKEWSHLPKPDRKPGLMLDDLGRFDPSYNLTPPPGGLVLKVYYRALARDAKREFHRPDTMYTDDGSPFDTQPGRDFLWITEAERKALVPADLKKGQTFRAPASITERILRFNLVDNSFGHMVPWKRDDIRSGELMLTVEEVSSEGVRLHLRGSAPLWNRNDEPATFQLVGLLNYDPKKEGFTRFDIVAFSENGHWHPATTASGPLGIAFELARGESPADRVHPVGLTSDWRQLWHREDRPLGANYANYFGISR